MFKKMLFEDRYLCDCKCFELFYFIFFELYKVNEVCLNWIERKVFKINI